MRSDDLKTIKAEIADRGLLVDDINLEECEVCNDCGKALLPDDEAYSSHNGDALCDVCSVRCDDCEEYYTANEIEVIDGFNVCVKCIAKEEV